MKKLLLSAAVMLTIITGCKTKAESDATASTSKSKTTKLKIDLMPKSGSSVSGQAVFEEKDGKVTFTANITGLKPGIHAIHIHEKADCSSADGTSAGGHWNPTFKNHGKWGSESYHKGDIGNFPADEFGNGTITMTTDEWCIGCGDPKKDILGKGLIVHQDADDYVTQPTGNAGSRVACSAIIK